MASRVIATYAPLGESDGNGICTQTRDTFCVALVFGVFDPSVSRPDQPCVTVSLPKELSTALCLFLPGRLSSFANLDNSDREITSRPNNRSRDARSRPARTNWRIRALVNPNSCAACAMVSFMPQLYRRRQGCQLRREASGTSRLPLLDEPILTRRLSAPAPPLRCRFGCWIESITPSFCGLQSSRAVRAAVPSDNTQRSSSPCHG